MSGRPPQHRPADPRTGRLYRVVGPVGRLEPPPAAVIHAKLDNLALVPASLLPFRKVWQELANGQPAGTTLVVLPQADSHARAAFEAVAASLRAKGQRVLSVPGEQLGLLSGSSR